MSRRFAPGLGAIQRGALVRLHRNPGGLTAADLADLSGGFTPDSRRTAAVHALNLLRGHGLVVTADTVTRPGVRGARPYRWVLTQAGRDLLAKGGIR